MASRVLLLAALLLALPASAEDATPVAAASEAGERPLTLADCYALAKPRNEEVKRAGVAVDVAKALRRAAGAESRPELDLRDDFSQQEKVSLAPPGGSTGSAVSFADRRNQAWLELSQSLLAPWSNAPERQRADRLIAAAEREMLDAERVLLGEVADAFFESLQAERAVATLEVTTLAERERLREVSGRQEVGLARRTEVLIGRTQLSSHESTLLRRRNDVREARARLSMLAGVSPLVPLAGDAAVPVPTEPSADDVADAMARRPDLAAATERLEASRAAVVAARRQRAPDLELGLDAYLDRDGFSDFQEATDWAATLELTVPIYDGGRVAADVAATRALASDAELARAQAERDARLEVRQAWLAYDSDRGELATLEAARAAAVEAHELAFEEYRQGLADNLEVLTAQQQLLDQELDLERQRVQVKLSWIALQLALGHGAEAILAEISP